MAKRNARVVLEWIEHNVSGGLHLVALAVARAKGDPRIDDMALEWIERNDVAGAAAVRQARAAIGERESRCACHDDGPPMSDGRCATCLLLRSVEAGTDGSEDERVSGKGRKP